jgi:hypothetical protein
VINESDQWLYVSSEHDATTATTTAANAFHTLKVAADGTLTEPFRPTVLPIGGSVPVEAQGITVLGAHRVRRRRWPGSSRAALIDGC